MKRRTRLANPLAIASLVAVFGAHAPARQPLLNLTPAQTPAPGTGAGALALAEKLLAEAEASDAADPIRAATAALRRLAARLLAGGERIGPPGSERVLLGRTLADRIPAIEAWLIDRGSPDDEPVLDLLAHDAAASLAAADSGGADPDRVVRDTLAMLARVARPPPGASGWIEVDPIGWPGPVVAADEWAAKGLITPETAAALAALDRELAAADTWPVYRRSAARLRALLAAGAAASQPPGWIGDDARDAIRRGFDAASRDACDPDSRPRGIAALEWFAALGAVFDRADRLEGPTPAAIAAVKRARGAVGQHLAVRPADPAEARRSLAAAERILGLASARADLPPETRFVRQVRPAFRFMFVEARNGEPQVLSALPEALRRADALTEPGVVAAISRQQQAIDDLRLLAGLSAAMTEPGAAPENRDPPVRPDWEGVASLVLAAGQSLTKPDLRDSALAELRTLADRVRRSAPIPGETEMDRAIAAGGEERAAWADLTGGREGELPLDIADRRRVWLASWGRRQFKQSDAEAQRLDNLCLLLDTLRDAAPVHAIIRSQDPGPARDRYAALQAWPGWQLSPEALARLADGLPARLSAATALVLGPEQDEATAQLESIRADYAPVRLAGRLMAGAIARGYTPETGASAALHELAAGTPVESGPGAAWLAGLRPVIADVCRYAEEIAAAETLNARDRAAGFRVYANARAAEALDLFDAAP